MRVAWVCAVLWCAGVSAQCPAGCSCAHGALTSLECDGATVRARDDLYLEIDCLDNAFNCSLIPRVTLFHGDTLNRMEITNCRGNATGTDSSFKCALEAVGARGTRALMVSGGEGVGVDNVRGMEDVTVLYVAATQDAISSIPTEAIHSLPSLRSLRLLSLSSPPLRPDMFLPPLPSLERLEVAMSGLEGIPSGTFNGLTRLKVLSLWNNHIKVIHEDAFLGLSSLQELMLSGNPLEALPRGVFRHTPLASLNMERVRLTELPEGVLSGMDHLKELKISTESELKLSPLSLSRLPSLADLQLSRSHLTLIPPSLLLNSTNVVNLTLSYNRLSRLPALVLPALKRLNLDHNMLAALEPECVYALKSLEELALDHNMIEVLPDRVFSGVSNLRSLSLSHNRIRAIAPAAFAGAPALASLHLDHNRLQWGRDWGDGGGDDFLLEPSSPFNMLFNLRSLSLRGNLISEVFSDWRLVLLQLNQLDLSHNSFTQLTAADVQFLHSNLTVDFSFNNISSVSPPVLFSDSPASSLRIVLGANPFHCSCNLYDFLTHLSSIYDVSNASCASPSQFHGVRLASVAPSDVTCPIEATDGCDCVVRPAGLRIECACDNIQEIPDPSELGLRSVALRLTTISDVSLPAYVTELNVSGSRLTEVPPVPSTLRLLDLSNNSLEEIPIELLGRNLTVMLKRNPFVCDCRTADAVALLISRKEDVADFDEVSCKGNRLLRTVDVAALCSAYRSALAGSLVAFLGLMSGVLAALVYRYRVEIQVYLYSEKLLLWLLPKEEWEDKRYDVFVSFAAEDEAFVCAEVLPRLRDYRLLVQDRDWEAGATIPREMRRSVGEAARTLLILSDAFVASPWAREGLLIAHRRAIADRRPRVVVLDRLTHPLDESVATHLALATRLRWGEALFWRKLRYALPRKDCMGGAEQEDKWTGSLNVVLNEDGKLVNRGFCVKE